MYQALYRKWRPRKFEDVVGQEHITNTLLRQVQTGRLSHAYLFVGTRGTGKTTCAKILAKAVNCEHPVNGDPCNACPSCLGIDSGSILDVEELDAASNNGVDNIRELRDEAIYTPASVKKRVYIVDEVHMLSNSAFNALLKILEEPPEHLIFILATTEIHKVPATILSRCQRFSFRRIPSEKIAQRLLYVAGQEQLPLTQDGASLLARLADGALRDALSLLDQCAAAPVIDAASILDTIGLAGSADTLRLLSAISSGDAAGALKLLDGLHSAGKDMAAAIDELMTLTRDILVTKVAGDGADRLYSGTFDEATLRSWSGKLSRARLLAALDVMSQAMRDMGKSANRRLIAEMCVIRLCDERLSESLSALVSRVSRLEDRMEKGVFPSPMPAQEADEPFEDEPYVDEFRETDMEPDEDFSVFDDPGKDYPPLAQEETVSHAQTVQPSPAASDRKVSPPPEDVWSAVLEACRNDMDIGTYAFLSDSAQCAAVVEGNSIAIHAKNPFAMHMIDSPDVLRQVREAAGKVLGRQVLVRATDTQAPSAPSGGDTGSAKLDSLSKYGVTFE